MVLRKSFCIHWSAERSPRVHEVNPGRDPSVTISKTFIQNTFINPFKSFTLSLKHIYAQMYICILYTFLNFHDVLTYSYIYNLI